MQSDTLLWQGSNSMFYQHVPQSYAFIGRLLATLSLIITIIRSECLAYEGQVKDGLEKEVRNPAKIYIVDFHVKCFHKTIVC